MGQAEVTPIQQFERNMNEVNPNVVVIAGPNGSGKSTVAPVLLRDYLEINEFVNADIIAQGLSGFASEAVAIQAGRIMLERISILGQQQADFAFETTLASRSFAHRLRKMQDAGYRIHVLFLWLPSPEMAIARVATRVQQGGHNVPVDTIRRRYHAGLGNFFSLYRDEADNWMFFDNSGKDAPRLIASQIEETGIQYVDHDLWKTIEGQYT